jgi:hypothetical protein
MSIQTLRNRLERLNGEQTQIKREILKTKANIKMAKRNQSQYERSLEIVKLVGLETQKALEYRLSEQVSLAEAAIFDDPYELVVNFIEKRGKTEAELFFKRRNLMIPTASNMSGHGAKEVAGLSTRVSYLTMRRDMKIRPTLFLDEPFARLNGMKQNHRTLALLNEISEKPPKGLGFQIIAVVNEAKISREMIMENADKVFLVTQTKGKSKVSALSFMVT